MNALLQFVQLLSAAVAAGMNIMPLLERASDLIQQRHAEGKTVTQEDLMGLFDEGDATEAAVRKQFADTLADPNTPKLD